VGQPWYFDVGMDQGGNLGTLLDGQRYEVPGRDIAARELINVYFDDSAGKTVELAWPVGSADVQLTQNQAAIAASLSLAQMRASSSSAYFYDAPAQRLRVKYVGASGTQQLGITADFLAEGSILTRPADSVAASTPGFAIQRFNVQAQSLRNPAPSSAPLTVSSNNSGTITRATTANVLISSPATTVLQGWINAPVNGIYTFSPLAAGGAADLYIGDQWVSGSRDNRWPVVQEPSADFNDESNQFALGAGWHPFKLVYVRDSFQGSYGQGLWLRWRPPGANQMSMTPVFKTP
jgi:hypothetical protein